MLPSKILASREEKSAPGHKKSKERLTVLVASNASESHKMKLIAVRKSTKPLNIFVYRLYRLRIKAKKCLDGARDI